MGKRSRGSAEASVDVCGYGLELAVFSVVVYS